MRMSLFVVFFFFAIYANADVLLDAANNACHVPTSEVNPDQEFHMSGCNPNIHIDANGNAWAYTWVVKESVPRRVLPEYPESPSGVLNINTKTAELGVPCLIRSKDFNGESMNWVSNDWHSSIQVRRTESEFWVSVRYSLYCYAGRPQ